MIRVNQKIRFSNLIKPACLHTDLADESPNVPLIAIGWGIVSTQCKHKICATNGKFNWKFDYFIVLFVLLVRNRSNILQKVALATVPLAQCNTTLLVYNQDANSMALRNGISESQLCAHDSDANGKKDTCQGDSGGPLQIIPSDSELAKVVGIVSFGITCASPYPSIYTRVASYIDWIEPYVWPNNEINAPSISTE